ncbi:MAG: hypothetical protein ACD_79C00496G0007 [uncultured bacterium]|nr:MAG: hypothetical protein ACD_79C00496G0007 [uncultured bacterium]
MKQFLPSDTKNIYEKKDEKLKEMNVSLFYDKFIYLTEADDSKEEKVKAKNKTIEKLKEMKFQNFTAKFEFNENYFFGKLQSRLLVNHAGGVKENAGLCFHRNFGCPMIPGTAVKGSARAQAIIELATAPVENKETILKKFLLIFGWVADDLKRNDSDIVRAFVFTDKNTKPLNEYIEKFFFNRIDTFGGLLSFLPAYPEKAEAFTMVGDIITPHHTKYYKEGGECLDTEIPVPNPFPAIEANDSKGHFIFRIVYLPRCNNLFKDLEKQDLLEQAINWLKKGLENNGVGAKTSSGYGLINEDTNQKTLFEENLKNAEEKMKAEALEKKRIESMSPEDKKAEELLKTKKECDFIGDLIKLEKEDEITQRATIKILKNQYVENWKSIRKGKKEKDVKKREVILKVAGKLGETMP